MPSPIKSSFETITYLIHTQHMYTNIHKYRSIQQTKIYCIPTEHYSEILSHSNQSAQQIAHTSVHRWFGDISKPFSVWLCRLLFFLFFLVRHTKIVVVVVLVFFVVLTVILFLKQISAEKGKRKKKNHSETNIYRDSMRSYLGQTYMREKTVSEAGTYVYCYPAISSLSFCFSDVATITRQLSGRHSNTHNKCTESELHFDIDIDKRNTNLQHL